MVWQVLKEQLRASFSENIYALWIEPLECTSCDENHLELACPDRFYRAYVSEHHLGLIQQQAQTLNPLCQVVLREAGPALLPAPSPARLPAPSSSSVPASTQLRLPLVPEGGSRVRSLHPRYTFDGFMSGNSNLLAFSACKSLTAGADTVGPCLYINSATGLGKSHLTHAVAHEILATSPATRLHYLTAQQFSREMVREIQGNSMDRFKRKYHEQCDVLLVEDIHTLTGKKKTQEEMNELLDSLIKGGKRVILTANSGLRELSGINEEFRSRMGAGLVTTIEAPDIQTRERIVQKKAELQGLSLAPDFVAYIAQQIQGDVRRIESAVLAIRAQSSLLGGEVEMALVRQVVEGLVGASPGLSAATIAEFVGAQFRVSVQEMQSRTRKQNIVFPRQVAMYLSRLHTRQSLAEIGGVFGRDHATVLHAIKVVGDRVLRDRSLSAQVELLNNKVKQM